MPCQVVIQGIQAGPPYALYSPQTLTVVGRTTADCTSVRVVVRAGGPASAVMHDQTVTTTVADATAVLSQLVVTNFLAGSLGLECGDRLYVEMTCSQDAACSDQGMYVIACKPDPRPGGSDHTGNGNGNGWPPSRCLFTAAAGAMMLLAALTMIATGVALVQPAVVAAGLALVAAAAIPWSLWLFWCQPSTCVRLAVLCWVFKRAFIAALPFIPLALILSVATPILLVIIAYGSVAGILVDRLVRRGCQVPSARRSLTQIQI
jgi:hypothetical protein